MLLSSEFTAFGASLLIPELRCERRNTHVLLPGTMDYLVMEQCFVQIPHLFPTAPDVQVSQPSAGWAHKAPGQNLAATGGSQREPRVPVGACTWGTAESSCSTQVALSSVSASTQHFFLDSLRKITSVTLKARESKSQEK